MNKSTFYRILLILLFPLVSSAQSPFSTNELKEYLYTLASDEFEGREGGTSEGKSAAEYVHDEFKKAGLSLLENDGFQPFLFSDGKKMGDKTFLNIDGYIPQMGVEYASYVYSPKVDTKSGIVFVGYGIENPNLNDYANVEVKNKWVLMLSGKPESETFRSIAASQSRKVDNARKKGAKGVIFVDPPSRNPEDIIHPNLLNAIFYNMPAMQIKRSLADIILKEINLTIESIVAYYSMNTGSLSKELNTSFEYKSDIVPAYLEGNNVVGILEGSDSNLKNEYIVVGGHFDHLGYKYKDNEKLIYYGADDNASGAAGVIALAKYFSKLAVKPKRSIIFVTFDSEEKGLLGSAYFVNNVPKGINKSKIVAMVNLDMIGRYREEEGLNIIGYNSSKEGESIIKSLAKGSDLVISCNNKMFNGSDHANFYSNNIPVFFFFTGLHADYHKPTDTPDKINYEGMSEVLSFANKLIQEIANRNKALKFKMIK